MDLWKAEEHPADHKWIPGAGYTSWSGLLQRFTLNTQVLDQASIAQKRAK